MRFIILIFLLVPRSCFADAGSDNEIPPKIKKIGEYTAIITSQPADAHGKLIIKKKGKTVYEQDGIDSHYYFGLDFDKKDKFSGKNITGNKMPNLVVTNWTGGASCCHLVSIFELGKEFRKIIELDAHTIIYDLIDLDKDGNLEIEIGDGAIRGVFTSTADTSYGRIIMKFIDNEYRVATDLMKKPRPNKKKIEKLKTQIKAAFKKQDNPFLPTKLLEVMMELSYSGHLDLAMEIAEKTWIQNKNAMETLETFKKIFVECLNDSKSWKEFSDSLNKFKK